MTKKIKTEKIIDFGELGKWSTNTLIAQSHLHFKDRVWPMNPIRIVNDIEEKYIRIKDKYDSSLIVFEKMQVKKMTVMKLFDKLKYIKETREKLEKLIVDFNNYRAVIYVA